MSQRIMPAAPEPVPPVAESGVAAMRRRRASDALAWACAIGLGAVVGMWSLTLTSASWASPAAIAVTVADLAGLIGVALLLGSVLLVARVPVFERVLGLDRLTAWHRTLAPYGAYLVTAHVILSIVGYAGTEGRGVLPQAWDFVVSWPDMLPAYAGFGLLVAAGVTSWRVARRRMKYETWWVVHLYTYLAIGLSLLHQLSGGTSFAGHPAARWIWISAHLAVLTALLIWRVGVPVVRSVRHDLRVDSVVTQASGAISLVLRGRHLDRLPLAGGQFFQVRIGRREMWWQAHPYSVSGLPWKDRVRFTIASNGDYAQQIAQTPVGTRVFVEGPYGAFTARAADAGMPVLLIGGGVGITPIRTLLDDLPASSRPVVVYRARSQAQVLFREELQALVDARGGSLFVLAGSRHEYPMDAESLHAMVPDLAHREVFVCGSDSLVGAVRTATAACGVPAERVHAEEFAW